MLLNQSRPYRSCSPVTTLKVITTFLKKEINNKCNQSAYGYHSNKKKKTPGERTVKYNFIFNLMCSRNETADDYDQYQIPIGIYK